MHAMLSLAMGVTPPRKLPIAQVDHHCAPRCDPGGWLTQPSDLERWYLGYSQGPETSKWLHYLDIYERHFSRLRGTNATIVEVGINNGGSLAMYRWYFGPRARIVGVDLFNSSFMENNPLYGSPDRMVRGDQQSREFWTWFKQLEPHVDVLIDDGGHQALQQLITFDEMFPHLQPGGILLTEDVMGASFEISNSSKESTRTGARASYVREIANSILFGDGGLLEFHFSRHLRQAKLERVQQNFFGVSFYPNVIVLEKLTRPRNIMMPLSRGDLRKSGTRPAGTHMG